MLWIMLGSVSLGALAVLLAWVAYRLRSRGPSWDAIRWQVGAGLWLAPASLISWGVAVGIAAARDSNKSDLPEGYGIAFLFFVVPATVLGVLVAGVALTLSRMRKPSREVGRAAASAVVAAVLFLASIGTVAYGAFMLAALLFLLSALATVQFWRSSREARTQLQ